MGLGQAVSYRFKRDGKGWWVLAITEMVTAPVVTDKTRGAVGVGLNADHLAISETDADGSWVHSWRAALVTCGKNTKQAMARIGDAVANVVQYAREAGKPIVIDRLDFHQNRTALEGVSSLQPDAVQFQLRQDKNLLFVPGGW